MLNGENEFKKLNERKITMSAGGFSPFRLSTRAHFCKDSKNQMVKSKCQLQFFYLEIINL